MASVRYSKPQINHEIQNFGDQGLELLIWGETGV
ncbi:unnamed protein product [Arabidopsis halleri]